MCVGARVLPLGRRAAAGGALAVRHFKSGFNHRCCLPRCDAWLGVVASGAHAAHVQARSGFGPTLTALYGYTEKGFPSVQRVFTPILSRQTRLHGPERDRKDVK